MSTTFFNFCLLAFFNSSFHSPNSQLYGGVFGIVLINVEVLFKRVHGVLDAQSALAFSDDGFVVRGGILLSEFEEEGGMEERERDGVG